MVRLPERFTMQLGPISMTLTYPLNQRATVLSGEDRNVADSWEMKAFVARSRTKAVGALTMSEGISELR